jgi:hypothetical protein
MVIRREGTSSHITAIYADFCRWEFASRIIVNNVTVEATNDWQIDKQHVTMDNGRELSQSDKGLAQMQPFANQVGVV